MLLDHNDPINKKPRKPLIAFLFSALIPGLGQLYNGQAQKTLIGLAIFNFFMFLFGATRWICSFQGFGILFVLNIIFRIYMAIDAIISAHHQNNYISKKYNTWLHYVLFSVLIVMFNMYINASSIGNLETCRISSTADSPTLQPKDRVMVDKKAYEEHTPDYGDIVVFMNTSNERHVFRIVGLPNDVVSSDDEGLSINGRRCQSTPVKDTVSEALKVTEYVEQLPNGHRHYIYRHHDPIYLTRARFKDVKVPEENYFVMGDNRENAYDSRYTGIVHLSDIVGRVSYIHWSNDLHRIGRDLKNN